MRHRKNLNRLSRRVGARKALLNGLATSLFIHESITTTLPKAKVLRSHAERLITKAKRDTLHARRLVARVISDNAVVAKLFAQLGPRFADRPGGYTRIYKLGYRRGDAADMAVIELVDRPTGDAAAAEPARKRLVDRESGDEAPAKS